MFTVPTDHQKMHGEEKLEEDLDFLKTFGKIGE